jgi:hypothetical protein
LTIGLNAPTCLLQFIVAKLLDVSKVWRHVASSGLIKMFTEFGIEALSLESEDEVMEDDT